LLIKSPLSRRTVTATLAQTPLFDWHAAHGGKLVDFAGWSMPVHYGSIVAEHNATRNAIGLFDVSHMGRLRFSGPGAQEFLDSLLTRRVSDISPGQVRYSLITTDIGGILDDVLIYRLGNSVRGGGDDDHAGDFLLVVNASNRPKIIAWIEARLCGRSDVELTDVTEDLAMIAVQGPLAIETVAALFRPDIRALKYYHCREASLHGTSVIVSRTGYTGEDGLEVIMPADQATSFWQTVLERGQSHGAMACGLGSRDTLRLEAAMPLYGHELTELTTPWQAKLDFAVDLEGRTFPGREVLCKMKQAPPQRIRVGLELSGKRVPREHFSILSDGQTVGQVTSGTFSPTLNKPIAMGYIQRDYAAIGTEVQIDVRSNAEAARVVKMPFYHRAKK
jgi:glycine cleavage system T protein (aminomethyltransferase)